MRKSAFTTVRSAGTSDEAQMMVGSLRLAGLHPVDVSLNAPLLLGGDERSFPVQVPDEEAEAAKQVLKGANQASV